MSFEENQDIKPVRRGRKKKKAKRAAPAKAAATKNVASDTQILNFIRGMLKNKHTATKILKSI